MLKNRNKRRNFNDYQYDQIESSFIYDNNYYNKIKYSKKSEYYNNKSIRHEKYNKDYKNNVRYFNKYPNFDEYESFYPKNYEQTKTIKDYNKIEITKSLPSEKYNNYFKKEKFDKKSKNNPSDSQTSSIQNEDEQDLKILEDNLNINEKIPKNNREKNKTKNSWIKSIPHPKRKKEHGNAEQQEKKNGNFYHKKEEKNIIKKERKLSFNSSQNNESTKQSINAINTSSSFNKEKDVSSELKQETDFNLIINSNLNNNFIKNKFDEEKIHVDSNNQIQQINKDLENTEILQVKVKISENEIATFKIKRYDDLFLTVSLFCEINSIDERLVKPIIIKALCSLNTIYQIYNCKISNENIRILKNVREINNIE